MGWNATISSPKSALLTSPSSNELSYAVHELPSLILTKRQLCDLELLLNGGFWPLKSYMNKKEYESVLMHMRLTAGDIWPMPITLDVEQQFVEQIKSGQEIALRDQEGLLLAILQVNDIWRVDKQREAQAVFATLDKYHPGVAFLYEQVKDYYLGGNLIGITLPHHYDFTHLRYIPAELRETFSERGWGKVVAFQTRNPMHRAHQELTLRAVEQTGAKLLIHPVVGLTKPGDIEYYRRVRCYENILETYAKDMALLSLLPLAMRMAGPREAVWHAIIRRNYGCTHFIVGRDHAGPGKNLTGQDFYDAYAAQKLVMQYQAELGIEMVPFQEMAYSQKQVRYFPLDQFPQDETPAIISGTALRERLQNNLDIPAWFSYPQVIAELRKAYPPKHQQGFTVFFTGLPSAGKSTLANVLFLKLREILDKPISLLDGDIIRTHLSRGLGFSREDRDENVLRVGFVAQEITKHRGIAICALVAPFMQARNKIRQMIAEVGGFIEVYVATPLSLCESRDRKGLYQKAREGLIKQFTGVSDPYEAPLTPEIMVDDTINQTPLAIINTIIEKIQLLGYIRTE